jgi:hypothetical protein
MASKTITQILDYVNSKVPNGVSTSDKIVYLSDIVNGYDFEKYNTEHTTWSTGTSSNCATYTLPTNVLIGDIRWFGISETTYNSTDVIGTTTPFTEYKYAGLREGAKTNCYTDFNSPNVVAIRPIPDTRYHMKVIHKSKHSQYSASSDSTSVITAPIPLITYAQYKLSAEICKSMAFPRIDMANNYEIDAAEALARAKMLHAQYMRSMSKVNISYKDWW